MINRSIEFRNMIPNEFKIQDIKATILEDKEEIKIKEVGYKFSSSLFKSVMRSISFNIDSGNAHNKNLNIKYGLLVDEDFEYLDLGSFFIKDLDDNKKSETLSLTGYDKMLNFMVDYKFSDLGISLPCTMLEFVKALANYCNTELYTEDFFNNDLMINEDFFTAQNMTCRDVLDKIAEATLSIIFIKDDRLYIKTIDFNTSVETLTAHDLEDLKISEKFGPLNSLVLGRGDVGDDETEYDEESISENGLQEIRIDENEFIDSIRLSMKKSMFQKIKGLEFYSYTSKDLGFLFLEPGDFIIQSDRAGNEYKILILNLSAKITTGLTSQTSAEIPEMVTTSYKYKTKDEKKTLKVERLAKKNEGLITDLVQETTETSEKLTSVEQTVDNINQKVSNMEEFTKTVESINQIHLTDTVAGDGYIIQLSISGGMLFLTPSNDLVPSNTLVPLRRPLHASDR